MAHPTSSSTPKSLPVVETGIELYNKRKALIYSSGCARLDQLLCGGFRKGEFIEIAGRSAVGKTQICITFAASVVYDSGGSRVLYIDTTGSFNPYRLAEIVLLRHQQFTENVLEKFLSRVSVVRIFSQRELMAVFDMLEENIDNLRDDLVAVIVDHVSLILNPEISSEYVAGYHRMVSAARRLKSLGSRYGFVAIVVNNAIESISTTPENEEREEIRAAMGKWWSTMATTRILLSKSDVCETNTVVKLDKCYTRPAGGTTMIELAKEGVVTPVPVENLMDIGDQHPSPAI